jgi:hypothetical protein
MRLRLRPTVIGVVVLVALALPGLARAGSGATLTSAFTAAPPAVNGTLAAGEWTATPTAVDFGGISAQVYLENTTTTQYIAVQLGDLNPGASPELSVFFDNNDNGTQDAGDDSWRSLAAGVQDYFYAVPFEGPPPGFFSDSAFTPTEKDNTLAARGGETGGIVFEISHPLCSGETEDMCIPAGDTVGVQFEYSHSPLASIDAPGANTTNPSDWANLVTAAAPATGSLTGTLNKFTPSTPAGVGVDLTATGSEDWAIWGLDSSTSLTPDARKNGGSEISALSNVGATDVRNFGMDPANPFEFTWSNGTPTGSASKAHAGLANPGVGSGVSFTVPADATPRRLTIFASGHYADGMLTAHLSDNSAPDYTATLSTHAGEATIVGENVPAVYTIHYRAASPEKQLTVTWVQTAKNTCLPSCEDVVLYAAALSPDSGSASGATATVTNNHSVEPVDMAGSNDAIADIPLRAFDPQATGTSATPINGLPINGLPINGLPINGLPINGLPINGLPINGLPINGLPINGLPINGLPINGLPINGLPLTTPGGWAAALAGTTLAGLPLQTVTLQQVLNLNPKPAAIANLKLGDIDLTNSDLGRVTIGALALGATPINGLGLPTDALAALLAWCRSTVPSPDTNCTMATIGGQSLFALALSGAPINGLPINGLPINGLPINGLSIDDLPINGLPINGLGASASPIADIPINGLDLGAIPINGLPADATLGKPGFPDGTFTVGRLLQILTASGVRVTVGDVIAMLIRRADVPWETLSPRLLSVFDLHRPHVDVTVAFEVDGSGDTVPATVAATVPAGFDPIPGLASLTQGDGSPSPLPDPVVTGNTLSWNLSSISLGSGYQLQFKLWSGTDVGPAQIGAAVASGGVGADAVPTSVSVGDSFEPNGSATDPEFTPVLTPNTNVEQSAITSRSDVDFYKVALPPAGTRLLVHLSNLRADYDLALYADRTTSVRTSANSATPLQDGFVGDEALAMPGTVNSQLTPTALQDVPDPGLPLVQVSPNRGTDDEDVGMVSPGGTGYAYIAVFGYNGASSAHPYSLRVTTRTPAAITCDARSFPSGAGIAGTLPAVSSLPANLNTVILVNEKRIGDTYGAAGETSAVAALNHLAGDTSLGVSGAVIPVEAVAQAKYATWDSNPCDTAASNAVANAIADKILELKAARPSLRYVVFAGGDDQIPFFRVPDLSRIANENGFASAFGRNEYYGALAGSNLLSDEPYLDTRPVPATGKQIFIPDLVGGRLVETPNEIAAAITRFESSNGTLARSSAFVSGYDFVSDGSDAVRTQLNTFLGTTPARTLVNNTWSKSDLFAAAFPTTGGPAAINDWNGHYDNHQALAANGNQSDLITTEQLTGPHALSGGIFFTMGCHAGFQTTDAIVGATSPDHLDWAQYFAGTGTAFVGNSGFGLGNTDSVAFSEELMAGLAGNLGGSLSMGEALARAKQTYYLSRTAFSSYDQKTLAEAELYGLPMYGIGVAPRAVGSPTPPPAAAADPVRGTTASTSPTQGSLAPLPGTSAQVAPFAATPRFSAVQSGPHGQFLTNDGQVQAPNYRPLQPYVTLPAARSEAVAHGVIVDSLTSSDISPFNPANVRPTLDLTVNEPEPQFTDQAWPAKIPTLVTLNDANGVRQSLGLATGQFFLDSTTHAGVERKWTQIGGRVTYSTSTDYVPPSIDAIDAYITPGAVTFVGRFSDRTETGAAGTVAFAQVVYNVNNTGAWVAAPMQRDATTGIWSAGAPFNAAQIQYFVEICDIGGNCGYSSNKGRYFNALPLPTGSGGGLAIVPSRAPDAGAFYTSAVDVTVTAPANTTATVSVDGGAFAAPVNPIHLAGAGAHVVIAHGSDGSESTRVFVIDLGPGIPVFTGIRAQLYAVNDLPAQSAIGCVAPDVAPGVTCVVTGYSAAIGAHTLTATASDGAGRTSTSSLTYTVGFQAGDILPPVTAPRNDQGDPLASDLQVFKIKSTVPVKFRLYLNAARTSVMTTPPAGAVAKIAVKKLDSSVDSTDVTELLIAPADSGDTFRWTGSPDYQYVFNASTSGLTAGTYLAQLTLYASNGTTILAQSAKQYFVLRP